MDGTTLLLLLGAICFVLAVLGSFLTQLNVINWTALGLLFWILTALLPRV